MNDDRNIRLAIAAAAGLALADASIVTLALPRLLTELGASVEGVAAVIGVYTGVVALALLPAEAVRRALGSRLVGALSLGLFAGACVGCAAAGSLELLLALRAVQALGAAGALVSAFDLLGAGAAGSPGRRLWTTASVAGVAAGPAIGGVLTQAFDWRAIFVAQVPVALVAAFACLRSRHPESRPPATRDLRPAIPRRPLAALGLVSAALTAVLFLIVILLVAGWNLSPLNAAVAVSVLPLAALAAARAAPGDPRARAATGCLLVAGGPAALAFLPLASAWWTVVPQALAGAGMGLALPALAGELIPETTPREAAQLLTARHAGIALALLLLAPIVAASLNDATFLARERGVALVLDSPLQPQDKIALAPSLLASVGNDQPRHSLAAAVARNRSRFVGQQRSAFDRLGTRADDTLVEAVAESFRLAFLIAGVLALAAGLVVLPAPGRRAALARVAALALAVPVAYGLLNSSLAPTPVKIANPCTSRPAPGSSGLSGVLQDQILATLDQVACHFGSSREELVLALTDRADQKRYEARYGVNPRSAGDLLQGLLGH